MACPGADLRALCCAQQELANVFAVVREQSLYVRPLPARNRIIFYLGHVEAFDWNLIRDSVGLESFSPDLDRLFAFGIDPPPGELPSDTIADWPELPAVREYCARVRESLCRRWDQVPEILRHVAIEHRLMHAETLAYMLHNIGMQDLMEPLRTESSESSGMIHPEKVEVPAGEAVLGMPKTAGFGWDNEFNEKRVEVPRFLIDRYKVTNGQYLKFVEAGGSPSHFWSGEPGAWFLRRMFDEIPLPLDWPVWVTQQQAAEYAAWCGGSLPSEEQWHRAVLGDSDYTSSGTQLPRGNYDARRWDPEPVNASPQSVNAFGVEYAVGNGWEWTSSLFRPFDGFQPFSFYPGYSANFFDDDHFVMKGASPRTDGVFVRPSFRNWFRRDYPYVFAGFRCIYKLQ